MDTSIPSAEQVRHRLLALNLKQLDRLSELSGVPVPTIYKIRREETKNPGIDTVRKILPHIDAAAA